MASEKDSTSGQMVRREGIVTAPADTTQSRRTGTWRAGRRTTGRPSPPWVFLLPAVALFVAFFLLPNLLNFYLPFTDWSGYRSEIRFTGLSTFKGLASDGTLTASLRITLEYAILAALFQNLFGLSLALLLYADTRSNRILRALFFLPVLISPLAIGYIFQALLAPDGALNRGLSTLTGGHVGIPWLGSVDWTIVVVAAIHGWKWMGLAMLVYLAGLKSVPQDVVDAARIDGADPWQSFRLVRWPLVAPAVTFNVAAALIGSLNVFDIPQATTGGGPASTTRVLNLYIFQVFGEGLYAQATAMSLVLFLLATAIAIPLVTYLRRRETAL